MFYIANKHFIIIFLPITENTQSKEVCTFLILQRQYTIQQQFQGIISFSLQIYKKTINSLQELLLRLFSPLLHLIILIIIT